MNGRELVEAMSHVDEKYISEAEEAPHRRRHWQELAITAACLALVLVGVWQFRPQLQKDAAPAVGAAQYKAEARSMEEAALDQANDAAPMMVSALSEMTVRVTEQTGEALLCVVTDPGTSDYQVNDLVKIALPEEAEQEAAQPAALAADAEPPQYEVSFLPDQGSDTITPAQWNLLEDG